MRNYAGRPRRRLRRDRPERAARRARLPRRPAEDRHLPAARRAHHRLRPPRGAARRRSAAAVLVLRPRASPSRRSPATSPTPTRAPTRSSAAASHRSPLYSGRIQSRGPRYCPSIEDKVVRFADKERHQIFLEPEGLDTVEVYPNGLSTSLPLDVQLEMVRSIAGPRAAEIMRPGLRGRVRLRRSDPAPAVARDQAGRAASTSPARSTARRATRRRRRRG